MKKIILPSLLILSSLLLISCSGGDNTSETSNTSLLPKDVQSAIDGEKSTLTQELKNTLSFMGNEERLAYDVYNALYQQFPNINQLKNISTESEYKHISAVQLLVRKYIYDENDFTNLDASPLGYKDTNISVMQAGVYDIKSIQVLYDELYAKGINSEQDALEVGCMVEVTDINDLNEKIEIAKNSSAKDIEAVFNFLREGSYNHYWAFDNGLKNKGIENGCCSLGTIDGVNYCHNEYPK
ncbi:hypothetical protein SAMN02745127_03136 [Oceanospirillum multiglobuliferum]|uniref:DUF2202 domain-containing protein n=1 Tax=Oceanospirillum multiglobuliferum TaxID=64969 RepID=A0A1T4SK25_9GAMM|nr:DUF2202 domain-containing protein [Oceanospirillum multiglobuliferum]OPX54204.1 hypothetical protein BTE48_15340 [Oceanospirillum multiglobuliferum]SKA28537.1 hypothetical protein SAMN02745127_03136 [Oceanospirillum multiglobuliferum]